MISSGYASGSFQPKRARKSRGLKSYHTSSLYTYPSAALPNPFETLRAPCPAYELVSYCSNWGLPASILSGNLLTLMASPCPRCGATKTGHVKRGLARWLLEQFGFRLRICGGCRRYRIFRFTRAAKDGGSNHDSSHAVPDTVNHEERKPPMQHSSESS